MKRLKEYAKSYNIEITGEMLEKFQIYTDFMLEYNEKVNLTAITELEDIIVKHFLDSLMLLDTIEVKEGATLVDIGTGAGFPGVPLKIVRPDLRITLLDSVNKRLEFLRRLSEKLDLDFKIVHARAEQAAAESPFRDGYDIAVSRAVTVMPALAEYCLPFVSEGGYFVAYKGPDWEDEYETAKRAVKLLGCKMKSIKNIELPDGSQRNLLVIEKLTETPDKYPRQGVNIRKKPL